jgi:outer membrane protein TolC
MKKLFIASLFFLYQSMAAQTAVDPYLKLAATHNPELNAKFNDFMASLEMIPQARGLSDPRISFGYFIQPLETRVGAQRASIGITQTFPWFGTLRAKEEVACQIVEAKLTAFEDAKLKLYQEVRVAYNELYFLSKAIRLTEENLQLLLSLKELARVNFESGKTGFVSVLRVEMEEKEMAAELALLRDNQKSSQAVFENLINAPVEHEMVFPDSLDMVTLDFQGLALWDSLMANNLQLRELKFQEDASHEQIEVARMMSRPSFSVGLNYTMVEERSDMEVPQNGKDAFLFPQVGMSIPLFRKKYQAMQNQAQLEKQQIQYQVEEKSNQLRTQLEFLIRDHLDGQRRIALYRNLLHLAERSLSLLQTEFTTGKVDFEEVLRMERKLLTYQLELEKARVDINNAVYKINYLTGYEKFEW